MNVTSYCVQWFTVVKTLDAVDQDKQGMRGIGFGQLVTAREAIWNTSIDQPIIQSLILQLQGKKTS